MSFQGNHSSRGDQEIMEVLGIQLQKILVRLSDKGFNLKWNNNEINILVFCRGCETKIEIKIQENSPLQLFICFVVTTSRP